MGASPESGERTNGFDEGKRRQSFETQHIRRQPRAPKGFETDRLRFTQGCVGAENERFCALVSSRVLLVKEPHGFSTLAVRQSQLLIWLQHLPIIIRFQINP